MADGPYGLPGQAVVLLVVIQCIVQGILITSLSTFLKTESNRRPWFKAYVVCVNVITAGQTVVHTIQVLDVIDEVPTPAPLIAAAPILTGIIGAAVQPFFMHRCWTIYHRRILPMVPILLLWLTTLVSMVAAGIFQIESPDLAYKGPSRQVLISLGIWAFASLIFDTTTTFSTIIYLYFARKRLAGKHGVFGLVWQILWASAAPPLILEVMYIIDGYTIPGSPKIVAVISAGMIGKFYVLSLMITLVGQKHIREHFERKRFHPTPPSYFRDLRGQNGRTHAPTVVQVAVHTVEFQLPSKSDPRHNEVDHPGDDLLEGSSLKSTRPNSPPAVKKDESPFGSTAQTIQST